MSVAAQIDYGGEAELPDRQWVWFDVCAIDDIPLDCGAAALLGGRQVAVVRVGRPALDGHQNRNADQQVYAISNYDPFSEAFVIARGIVGDRDGCPKIASPLYKQSFDLQTGVCLDDPSVVLATYPVRLKGGRIEVGVEFAREVQAGVVNGRDR